MPDKIVSHITMPIDLLTVGPEDIGQYWQNGMANSASEIDRKRKHRIKSEDDYISRVADPSSKIWSKCFADDFISRAGLTKKEIAARQAENISAGYEKYNDGLEAMFKDDAELFKQSLADGKKHYLKAVGKKLLAFTGTPTGGRGPAAIACLWLTNDNVIEGEMKSSYNILAGGPFAITNREMASAFKSALNARLIQAGSVIVGSNYATDIIKRHNDITNQLVNKFVDPSLNLVAFTTGGKSHVDYAMENKAIMILEIKVMQKV